MAGMWLMQPEAWLLPRAAGFMQLYVVLETDLTILRRKFPIYINIRVSRKHNFRCVVGLQFFATSLSQWKPGPQPNNTKSALAYLFQVYSNV